MRKFALLFLALPLASCATAQQNQPTKPHVFLSHWNMDFNNGNPTPEVGGMPVGLPPSYNNTSSRVYNSGNMVGFTTPKTFH
jgi:hypothetical protein